MLQDVIRKGEMTPDQFRQLISNSEGQWIDYFAESLLGYNDPELKALNQITFPNPSDSSPYLKSDADRFRRLLKEVSVGPDDVLIDPGCVCT